MADNDFANFDKSFELLDLHTREINDVQDRLKQEFENLSKQITDLKKEYTEIKKKTSEIFIIKNTPENPAKETIEVKEHESTENKKAITAVEDIENIVYENKKTLNNYVKKDENLKLRESTSTERNELLSNLRAKLDNINIILQKAKNDKITAPDETKSQNNPMPVINSVEVEPTTQVKQFISSAKNTSLANQSDKESTIEKPTAQLNVLEIAQSKQNTPSIKEYIIEESKNQLDIPKKDTPQQTMPTKDFSKITTLGEAFEAISAEPENFKHYITRANLYINKKDYLKAEADYKKAQTLTQSKDISVLLSLAQLYNLTDKQQRGCKDIHRSFSP
ncbi:MAG: hypothetical protein LBS81_02990 [Endomicrobium sp.]|jgi:hypothetical protein|nr:hypothetical protein [Endomicrobium sp.]